MGHLKKEKCQNESIHIVLVKMTTNRNCPLFTCRDHMIIEK